MSVTFVWLLIAFGPTLLAGLLGLRAIRGRTPNRWDDYRDVAILLEMIAGPMMVVASPRLVMEAGLSDPYAGLLGAAAILLFYVTVNSFSLETAGTLHQRLSGILAGSSRGLGMAAFLALKAMEGEVSHIYPSAQLFVVLLWAWYMSYFLVSLLVRGEYRARGLGASKLLTRVHEIAERCGVRLDQVSIITKIPGRSRCVNAVAVYGTQVALTQDLISNLSKAEVDAVIEHEIGHIADERIWSLDHALHYGSYLLMLALAFGAERHAVAMQSPWAPMRYVMWLAMFLIPGFIERWYSRKNERKANLNVGVDTDPLSAISGIYKVSVLNHHSLSRPWWSRIMSTHPYADEEIRDIAMQAGLSAEQVQQRLKIPDAEIQADTVDRYHLPTSDDAVRESGNGQAATKLVPRPKGIWISLPMAFIGGCIVLGVAGAIGEGVLGGKAGQVVFVIGLVGFVVTMILPVALASRNRRRIREHIRMKLEGQYGSDAVSNDLLVDVMLPDWEDRDQPWQGALLGISDGELVIRGEVSKVIFPLHTEMSVFRWADEDSVGSEARMVAIGYQDSGNPRAIHVRILGRPSGRVPSNWKQLEKHIKNTLAQAGASLVPREALVPSRRRKLKWSARVPIAAAALLLILAVADFVAKEITGPQWDHRMISCFITGMIAGPSLWAWATGAYKPDDQKH